MKLRWFVALLFFLVSSAGAQTTKTPKAECEALMDAALPFADQMLERHGEFFPYGHALKNNGEMAAIAGYDGREKPPSAEVIRLLKYSFVQGAKSREYKATALVYDVKITLPKTAVKSDAIAVSLNHRDNYSVVVFFPYQLKNGKLTFGETFAQKGESDIFTSTP